MSADEAFADALPYAEATAKLQKLMVAQNPDERPTKEMLFEIGKMIWPLTYQVSKDDHEAFDFLVKTARNFYIPPGIPFDRFLLIPNQQVIHMGASLWAETGFRQIVMGHKYAASLMTTRVTKEAAELVQPPWRAFYVEIPKGLLLVHDPMVDQVVSITGVLVMHVDHKEGGKRWAYVALSETAITLWRHGYTTEMLLDKDLAVVSNYNTKVFSEELKDIDERTTFLLGRLIVNTCLAMSDPTNVKPPNERQKNKGKGKHREADEPRIRTYTLGSQPNVDTREYVTRFVREGTERSLNVQVLVAGHWKTQRFGPAFSQSKVIHIEAYWRGPEDAPVLVRPQVLKE